MTGLRILALVVLVWAGGSLQDEGKRSTQDSKQPVIPLPADLVHPSELPLVMEDSYESLLAHGHALAEYGGKLSVYARPACEAATYFSCYDTTETSTESVERWLPQAIKFLRRANELRPSDPSAHLLLMNAYLSASNLSAALDLYEGRWGRANQNLGGSRDLVNRAHVLTRVHVLSTRNCWWGELARAHSLIKELLRVPNATMPAMHMAELPSVTPEEFLWNTRQLNQQLEAELAGEPRSIASVRTAKKKKQQQQQQQRRRRRLTVGYVAGNGFQQSSSARALLGLFLARSRERFRVVCYAGAGEDGSGARALLRANCDSFLDAALLSPAQLARQIEEDGVEVLVDVLGFGASTRLLALPALLPAPLHLAFHGQPFSSGSRHVDYYVSDPVSSPAEHAGQYSERLLLLPHYYLANDLPSSLPDFWHQARPPHVTRKRHNLKKKDVVVAYFGQPHKISPRLFASWLRVLSRCPDAKLWLFRFPLQGYGGAEIEARLREEAERAGVAGRRVVVSEVFAKEEEHAAKGLADVFADTRPLSAHTTMADALFAGLPAVTLPGPAQPSRVGASLVLAAGHAGFVARSEEEYEEAVVRLVQRARLRRRLRRRLHATLTQGPAATHAPLWDVTALSVAYEAGLRMAWEAGEADGGARRHVLVSSHTRARVLRQHGLL